MARRPWSYRGCERSKYPDNSKVSGVSRAEEGANESGAFGFEDAAVDLRAVVEPAVAHHVPKGPDCAGFGLPRAEHQHPDARQHKGTGTHRARLESHYKGAVGQLPPRAGDGRA